MKLKIIIAAPDARIREIFQTEKLPPKRWIEEAFVNIINQFILNAKVTQEPVKETSNENLPGVRDSVVENVGQ